MGESRGTNGTANGCHSPGSAACGSHREPAPGLDTEFLIVGCGPAGASLACFLASYGLKGIMIGSTPGTADTPRAHITNMAAMECLRDIGLQHDIDQVSSKDNCMIHTRWCHSMAGDEFARLYSWGNDPCRKGDYEMASPCKPADLPQTLLEPVLIRNAVHNGFKVRFDTTLVSFTRDHDAGTITALVRDGVSNLQYEIRTKYLFGADGARSQVVQQLDLPLDRKPGQGLAYNVLVKTDLSHIIDSRMGNLHWVIQPDREHPDFGCMCVVRMVKPWTEWMFILLPSKEGQDGPSPPRDALLQRVKDIIGDDTPAEILSVSKWYINEVVAEQYSDGNVFCLGDAVHRHPPMNGLGSNTCIQDAYNLAWKIAYVHRGLADRTLLSTYSLERQPVGKSIVSRANQAFRDHFDVWETLGMLQPDLDERKRIYCGLFEPGTKGQKRRQDLRRGIQKTVGEFHGLGVEMGQHYTGNGVYDADESSPFQLTGCAAENPVQYHEPNTYPGSRLPHVWLNKTKPTTPTSTIDIAGHGRFVLFTGIGGEPWKAAVKRVSEELGVPLQAHSIGFRQEWEDFYFEWERLRGVEESGAVLVRPDRFVAWRAGHVLQDEDACAAKLGQVLRSVLGLQQADVV
ncbi:hypothetical protein HIM_04939 [Hirsutella minnesotensis 3608]|uniref:FAD-binding domain-containing protein n=1 Tax=Hirsutella minnesotensis 3608 TaxID=1043627 RepID=A0A0F8A117_9HYPO|nr:hypothetical protein HIM_04939 [Hirsutella minnesotensis 3608]